MPDQQSARLVASLLNLDEEAATACAEAIAASGDQTAIAKAIEITSKALGTVGKRFQEGEWFLTELVYAGEISKEIMTLLTRGLAEGERRGMAKIVVGTVKNDLHDLGKDIFICFAKGAGFELIDLGVNVSAERFLDAVEEHHPLALGLSCLLTSTDFEIENVVEEAKRRGLRDDVKIFIGGAALTEDFARAAGADAFAPDAVSGVELITRWSEAE